MFRRHSRAALAIKFGIVTLCGIAAAFFLGEFTLHTTRDVLGTTDRAIVTAVVTSVWTLLATIAIELRMAERHVQQSNAPSAKRAHLELRLGVNRKRCGIAAVILLAVTVLYNFPVS